MKIRNALRSFFKKDVVEKQQITYTEEEVNKQIAERAYYLHLRYPDYTDEENWHYAEALQKLINKNA